MNKIRLTAILLTIALAVPSLSAAERGYVVTLKPAQIANETRAVAEDLASLYGGRLGEERTAGQSFVMRLSETRVRLVGADPRVQSVVPLEPVGDAATPREVVAWGSGISYSYDGSGNITQIGKDKFAYDHVGRLLHASVNGTVRNYEYDLYGNRKKCRQGVGTAAESDCQGYTINSSDNHIAEAVYDPAGSGAVTTLGIHNYSYDEFLMLKRDQSAEVREFVYTAGDERIATYHANSRTWSWTLRDQGNKVLRELTSSGGAYGTASFQWQKDYVWRDDLLLASVQPEGGVRTTYHYHLDHVGTPRRITDKHDNLVGFHDYFAFGPEVNGGLGEPSPTTLAYTAHERDRAADAFGTLDYMHARYYNPALGRFLTLDPGRDWDVHEPQSWNLYTYVRNNPITGIDPTGKWGWNDFKEWIAESREDIRQWWRNKWHEDIPTPPDRYGTVEALEAADMSPEEAQELGNPEGRWANARAETGAILSDEISMEVATQVAMSAIGGIVVKGLSREALMLRKSLASQAQMAEAGQSIAGAGSRTVLRDTPRLVATYGGEAGDWAKMRSSSYTAPDGVRFETHWYENVRTGQRVEFKTKLD